jgi:hypothetical protein
MVIAFIERKISSNWITIVCLLILAGLLYFWYSQPLMSEKAYVSCQDSVKQQLAPSTGVVFPDFNKIVNQRINAELTLKGYYDFPDSSGTVKRGYYTCVFEIVKENETRLISTKLY